MKPRGHLRKFSTFIITSTHITGPPEFLIITALCAPLQQCCEESIDVRSKNGINISNGQKIGFIIPFSDSEEVAAGFRVRLRLGEAAPDAMEEKTQ
ncbi:hypothetical protein ACFVTJ_12100 [Agrobacterium sp. NPDC058088]|uniref:hypothetical protein n=1 Tax=Agrobacterium sp. NPDC058088 TaxID=3346335 RepID=UPI0036DBE499